MPRRFSILVGGAAVLLAALAIAGGSTPTDAVIALGLLGAVVIAAVSLFRLMLWRPILRAPPASAEVRPERGETRVESPKPSGRPGHAQNGAGVPSILPRGLLAVLVIGVAVLLAALFVAEGSTPHPSASEGEKWTTYVPLDGSYSVDFPGQPYEKHRVNDLSGDLSWTDLEVGWVSADRSTGYWVNVYDYPAGYMTGIDVRSAYDVAQSNAISAAGGALVAARDVVLAGHLGREYTATAGATTVVHRMYLVGDRVYNLDTNSTRPDAEHVAKFFGSFALHE